MKILIINRAKSRVNKFYIFSIIFMMFFSVFNITNPVDGDPIDLEIQNVVIPGIIVEGDDVLIRVTIVNNGDENITTGIIKVDLLIDNGYTPVSTNSTSEGLSAHASIELNLSWTAETGNHTLTIVLSYNDIEQDTRMISVSVSERETDLTFIDELYIDGRLRVGKPVTIYANATNIGKNTTQEINATLFIDELYYNHSTIDGLSKGETHIFFFEEWIPTSFGYHTVNVTLDPKKQIPEQDETNNYIETTVSVDASGLDWWNTSWHYRKFYKISGSGNISDSVNFTKLLNDLNVTDEEFENNSITIVKYNDTGGVDRVVSNYSFNESEHFNNTTNATGDLVWSVSEPSFYCVYFDVKKNKGIRVGINETLDMNESGNPSIDFEGSAEGWWTEQLLPFNNYYLPNEQMSIQMRTKAEANSTKATFYWNGANDPLELQTNDNITWFGTETFTKEGNWTVEIVANDNAEYQSDALTYDFYVGYPDLTVVDIDFTSGLSESPPFYEGSVITIDANVITYNTTVRNVTVALYIDNELNDTKTNLTITKDKDNIVNFDWEANRAGTYNVSVVVDPETVIPESNENNNMMWDWLHIEAKPDLGVVNISIPTEPVDAGDKVIIYANITNAGEGNATNYRVNLCLEQNDEDGDGDLDDIFCFKGVKNHTFVNITVNETINISLIWDPAEYGVWELGGVWIVGVKIITSETKPDSNNNNNSMALMDQPLKVNPSEYDPPEIQIIKPTEKQKYEQGTPVEIIARVTDESGIGNVTIEITNPENTTYNTTMTKQANNKYSYTFEDTQILGIYNFSITAVDKSKYKRERTVNGTFEIIEDKTPPDIDFVGVLPSVQLRNKEVTISCIALDPSGVESVQVTIIYPNDDEEVEEMTNSPDDDKYYYTQSYKVLGGYEFEITAKDTLGNEKTTIKTDFWITTNLEDTDSDGMPDWWEEKYGFDPFDPSDATEDEDDDGYTNLEEYNEDMDPLKPLSLLQRIVKESKENWIYVLVSGILFIVVIALSIYGVRRRRKT